MGTTKVENSTLELVIESDVPISALSSHFAATLQFLGRLNTLAPMSVYDIMREGSSDVWNVTAQTQDERNYATTVTFVGDEPFYSATSLTLASLAETRLFLELIEHFVPVLKTNGVSNVAVVWEQG